MSHRCNACLWRSMWSVGHLRFLGPSLDNSSIRFQPLQPGPRVLQKCKDVMEMAGFNCYTFWWGGEVACWAASPCFLPPLGGCAEKLMLRERICCSHHRMLSEDLKISFPHLFEIKTLSHLLQVGKKYVKCLEINSAWRLGEMTWVLRKRAFLTCVTHLLLCCIVLQSQLCSLKTASLKLNS